MKLFTLFIILPIFILTACKDKKEPDGPVNPTGRITFQFRHLFKDEPVKFDTMMYVNEAGNRMMFTEIQYFISDVTLHYSTGETYLINEWKDIHYIDSDIPTTLTWNVFDKIPAGHIDSISFIFGIDEEKNQSFLFVNPPESLMFWPDILGGGYHYLKLNGKWLTPDQQVYPFNFHLGIGQIVDNEGNIIGFIQNNFTVTFKTQSFPILENDTVHATFIMDVDSWFDTPEIWDLDHWGGDIMQNQAAMEAACKNGRDAFRISLSNNQ